MFHIPRKRRDVLDDEGLVSPITMDKFVLGYGKAYGPARVKQFARMMVGGSDPAHVNVDNYVYFLVARYLKNKWGACTGPIAYWKPMDTKNEPRDVEPGYTTGDAYAENPSLELLPEPLSDWDLFAGTPCSTDDECVGLCPVYLVPRCNAGEQLCRCGTFAYDPESAKYVFGNHAHLNA